MKRSAISFLAITLMAIGCGGSSPQDDVDLSGGGEEQTSSTTPSSTGKGKVWSVSEVLSEPRGGGSGGVTRCGGELGFRRCVCPDEVPGSLRYRPALAECNGNAAAILDGEYLEAFSIVARDSQNRDRWPAAGSGFGGCDFNLANSESPPNRCSAFKVQDKFLIAAGTARVHCFGASGYSDLFQDVVRVTIKKSDDPSSSNDDIDRLCLISGDKPLN